MKKTIVLVITVLCYQVILSQNFQEDFAAYMEVNDTINQLKVLTDWDVQSPNDPELFTSYFNYHFKKSIREVVQLTTDEMEGDRLMIQDSLGETVGFLGSEIQFDPIELKKGLNKIDDGIKIFPNRLDMRFGKIHTLGEVSDWDLYTEEIIKTIQYSAKNNNEWLWTNNETLEDGKNIFFGAMQDYQLKLYDTGDQQLLLKMRTIASEMIKFYPESVESLTNLSITYLITEEYDAAITTLQKASVINPKDTIVLANIAHAYYLKDDISMAISYYEKILPLADDQMKDFVLQRITELKQ